MQLLIPAWDSSHDRSDQTSVSRPKEIVPGLSTSFCIWSVVPYISLLVFKRYLCKCRMALCGDYRSLPWYTVQQKKKKITLIILFSPFCFRCWICEFISAELLLHHNRICHDDVIKWKHFPRYWPFVRGINWSPVNSRTKASEAELFMLSLICAWINGWVNNRKAGDFRRHRGPYDVTVMYIPQNTNLSVNTISTVKEFSRIQVIISFMTNRLLLFLTHCGEGTTYIVIYLL